MKQRTPGFRRCLDCVLLLMLFGLPRAHAADAPAIATAAAKVAKVANPVKESELASITLTAQAEQRLGIATSTVERKKIARIRFFGGDVVLPLGPARGEGNKSALRFAPNPPGSPAEVLQLAEAQALADLDDRLDGSAGAPAAGSPRQYSRA